MLDAEFEESELAEKPKFVLVEMTLLEQLLQRCTKCGSLPGGLAKGKPRSIKWKQNGTNLTAEYTCSCNNNHRIWWATQNYIPGTRTRVGNLAITAASQVAPIGYPELNSMFEAAQIPIMSRSLFAKLSKWYVWPAVEEAYFMEKEHILSSLPDSVNVSMDGQYDSPGFSAELCAVSAIESSKKQVIDFAVVHKSETQNISGRMELEAVKKCLSSIESRVKVKEVTVDKHLQVVSYLQSQNKEVRYDPWHRLKGLKKELQAYVKSLKDEEEKKQMKELARRFIIHVYKSIELADGDAKRCQELVFSFFLHIQDVHQWTRKRKFMDIISTGDVNVCLRFKKEKFERIEECLHITEGTHPDSKHQPIMPDSKFYKKILACVSKTTFMTDLDKLRINSLTSYVENLHSVVIKYRPKRKFFPLKGFTCRTMLAAMAYNAIRREELDGTRRVSAVYETFSKSKREVVTKIKKTPAKEDWKKAIVENSIRMKQDQGPGNPDVEETEDEVDILMNKMEELLCFDSDNDVPFIYCGLNILFQL